MASVRVYIYNQPYSLRSEGDGEYVRRIAEYVDRRMHEISSQTHIVDYGKVAVLAALNIADELHRARAAEEAARMGRAAPRAEAPPTTEHGRGVAWNYADIFEELPERREGGERMSQQVTSKLRQYRSDEGAGARREPHEADED